MKRIKQYTRRHSLLTMALMAGMMAVVGCGDLNRSLVSSGEEVSVQEAVEAPAGYIVFSQRAAVRAAKKINVTNNNTMVHVDNPQGLHTQMVQHEFDYKKNKQISIKFDDYTGRNKDLVQVKQAQFSVAKKSIDTADLGLYHTAEQIANYTTKKGINIRMQVVTGTQLEDVIVAFGPEGLKFDPTARLRLQLKGNLTEVFLEGQEAAFHIGADGTITKVRMNIENLNRSGVTLVIEVPGFSRYTIDD